MNGPYDHTSNGFDVSKLDATKEIRKVAEEIVKKKNNQLPNIMSLVEDNPEIELFHDNYEINYVRILHENQYKIFPINSDKFKHWLIEVFRDKFSTIPSDTNIRLGIQALNANASMRGKKYELHNRVCSNDNAIWYDIGNWKAVRITPDGWIVIDKPPILFKKYKHQKPNDDIAQVGNIKKLLDFVSLKDNEHKILYLVYLISCFIPDIPHPVLPIHGEKGSTKTTFIRFTKELVDPSETNTLSMPKDSKEFIQTLAHNYLTCFDNVSYIQQWQSDALCRASTGEGSSKRSLYTDDEDFIYKYRRCVALTGTELVVTQSDLLDRSLIMQLDKMDAEHRKSEEQLWNDFNQVKPEILCGIFDTLVKAMQIKPHIKLDKLPRMADFAIWGCAITESLGYDKQDFIDAYTKNIDIQVEEGIFSSPIGSALIKFMEVQPDKSYDDCSTNLHRELTTYAKETLKINTNSRTWPKDASMLGRRITDIKGNLRKFGIIVEKYRDNGCIKYLIENVEKPKIKTELDDGWNVIIA